MAILELFSPSTASAFASAVLILVSLVVSAILMSLSLSASAFPISPKRFCSATLFLASFIAFAAASFPRASM